MVQEKPQRQLREGDYKRKMSDKEKTDQNKHPLELAKQLMYHSAVMNQM